MNLPKNEKLKSSNSIQQPSQANKQNQVQNKEKEEEEENVFEHNENKLQSKHQQFELLFSPRTSYSLEVQNQENLFNDLTLNFDPITIKIIKKHFKERLGSLNITQFIAILKNHLLSWNPSLYNREKKLIVLLNRLFQEVDLNNNGSMEWSEFCNYIIHNSNTSNVSNEGGGGFRSKVYSLSKNIVNTKEHAEVISSMFLLEKYNIIGVVEEGKSIIHFFDSVSYKKLKPFIDLREIQRDLDILESKELDEKIRLQVKKKENLNEKADDFSDDNDDTFSKKKKNQYSKEGFNIHESYRKVGIITTVFISELDVLLVSQSNKKITSWKYVAGEFKNDNNMKTNNNDSQSSYEILFSNTIQYCMTWDQINKSLFTGQEDGKIHKWDLNKSQPIGLLTCESALDETEKKKSIKKKKFEGTSTSFNKSKHMKNSENIIYIKKSNYESRDFVTCLLVINKIQVLAASYLNGRIILWDTLLMNKRKVYKNKLNTGIYNIVYDTSKNLLFACGFDSKIMVYDPYIDNEIYSLDSHMVSITNLIINEKENELISYDINGNIKVWDTNTFICEQSMNPYEGEYNLSKTHKNKNNSYKSKTNILLNKKTKQILCYRKHFIKIYEVDRSLNPLLCDDQVVFAAFYDKVSKLIITVCLRKIKMWNPFTGKISKIYDDPMKGEVTSLVMDPSYKRIFLGDSVGNIKCFNLKNGKFLKDLEGHKNSEISILLHSQLLEKVISSSIDNVIKIHDDKELNESFLIKKLNILTYNIKSMVLMENLSRLVIGLSSGICKFYDIEHFRYDSDIHSETSEMKDEIISLYQFNNYKPLIKGNSLYKVKSPHEAYDNKENNQKDDNENESYYNIILSSHASGKCKLTFTPPSSLKFTVIYEFIHLNINSNDDSGIMRGDVVDTSGLLSNKASPLLKSKKKLRNNTENNTDDYYEKDYSHHTPVTCLEFDFENYRLFTGDQIGKIRCYNFKDIFHKIDSYLLGIDSKNKNWLSEIHDFNTGKGHIKANTIWYIEAHKESIKHLHYVSVNPNIIISTSHDLKVKIFKADTGEYIDELKQISNKYLSIPIGIKFKGIDPISKVPYEKTVMRDEISSTRLGIDSLDEIESKNIADYSEKISLFNAKEKLLSYTKNSKLSNNMSNKWNLMIDISNIRRQDKEEMYNLFKVVKEKEELILKTEMMMQEVSIYSDAYKPLFIYEMDETALKEFSKVLNQKLRHVKLAISKANLGQNKYKSDLKPTDNRQEDSLSPKKSIYDRLNESIHKMTKNNEVNLIFNYDNQAKTMIKEYSKIKNEKNKLFLKKKELPKTREGLEMKRKLNELINDYDEKYRIIDNQLREPDFEKKHLKPSASKSVKLPQIKSNFTDKKPNQIRSNYNNIVNINYKPNDQLTVGERFMQYQDEYNKFMETLNCPLKKVGKILNRNNDNKIDSLCAHINYDNYYERNKNSNLSDEYSSIENR